MPQILDISSGHLPKINKLQNKRQQESTRLSPLWWGKWKPVWSGAFHPFSFLFYNWRTRGVLAYQSTLHWKLSLGIWKPAVCFSVVPIAFRKPNYWCILLSCSSDIVCQVCQKAQGKTLLWRGPMACQLIPEVYWSLSRSPWHRLPVQFHERPFSSIWHAKTQKI